MSGLQAVIENKYNYLEVILSKRQAFKNKRIFTRALGGYTGKTPRDGVGREAGGGIRMGSTCKSMADSGQCMAKTSTIL